MLGFPLSIHGQYDQLLNKTYAQRFPLLVDFYEQHLEKADSAENFKKIIGVERAARAHGDKDLLLEAAFMRAHFFYYHEKKKPERVLHLLDSLKRVSIEQHRIWGEILAENMMALYNFKMLQNYGAAFEHHQRVYNLLKKVSPLEFPHKQSCLYQMADEHYFFGDYREAIQYLTEAMDAEPKRHIQRYYLSIPNTLGLCYRKLNKLDSSTYYFRDAYKKAVETQDTAWQGISSGNIGINLFLQAQYNEAKPLLEKDISIALQTGDTGAAASSMLVLAKIALAQKAYHEAEKYINEARHYVYISGQYARLETLYPLLSKLYAWQGDSELSMLYLDSAMFVKDSLDRKFNSLQMTRAKQKVELERHKAEMEGILNDKETKTLERNGLLALVFLLFIMAMLLFVIYSSRAKRKQEESAANLKDAEQRLLLASQRLAYFTKNVSEKNQLLEKIESQLEQSPQQVMEDLQKSIILTESDWIQFKALFEQVHPHFFATLKHVHPDMTPAEMRFLALCKIHLSTREMAAMLGISVDAIRKQRHRLRKKLETLQPGTELEDFVTNL